MCVGALSLYVRPCVHVDVFSVRARGCGRVLWVGEDVHMWVFPSACVCVCARASLYLPQTSHTHTHTHAMCIHRWQTKPRMTIHGDVYYENKENETSLKDKKPGDLSPELKEALGIPLVRVCVCLESMEMISETYRGPTSLSLSLSLSSGANVPLSGSAS